jgi:hypothetical protein
LYQESKDVFNEQITQSDQLDDKNQSSDEENDSSDKLLNDIRETKFYKELDFAIRESNDENDLTNGSELIKDLNLEIGSTKMYRVNVEYIKLILWLEKRLSQMNMLKILIQMKIKLKIILNLIESKLPFF